MSPPTSYDTVKFHSSGDMYVLSASPIHRSFGDVDFARFIAECAGAVTRLLRPLMAELHPMTTSTLRSDDLLCVGGAASGRGGGIVLQSSKVVLPTPMSSATFAIRLCREAERVALQGSSLPLFRIPADWDIGQSASDHSLIVASQDAERFEILVQLVGSMDSHSSPLRPLRVTHSNPLAVEERLSSPSNLEVEYRSQETDLLEATHLSQIVSWFPFLQKFFDAGTEALFAEECRQRLPLLLLTSMYVWSTTLIILCGTDYNLGQIDSEANPLWWALAAFGVTCCWSLHIFFVDRHRRMHCWVAHVACCLFTVCVLCAVFMAPDDSIVGSGQLTWMYVLFSVSSSRSMTLSPLAMWSLDSCTAVGFLLNTLFNFPFEGEAGDLRQFYVFACIAHLVYSLLLWLVLDDSSRKVFAAHQRAVLLKTHLRDNHLRLRRAIDAVAIKGVAADLLGKFRSKDLSQLCEMFRRDRVGRHAMHESNLRTACTDCAVVELQLSSQHRHRIEACLWVQQVDFCISSLSRASVESAQCTRTVLIFGDVASIIATAISDRDEISTCSALIVDTISAISSLASCCSRIAAVVDYGPAVGGMFGSVPTSFEYFGSTTSRARLLLESLPQMTSAVPNIVVTDRFYSMMSTAATTAIRSSASMMWKVRSLPRMNVRQLSIGEEYETPGRVQKLGPVTYERSGCWGVVNP